MQHHTLETIYTLLSASNSPKQNLGVEIKKLLPFIAQLDPQNYLEHYQELIILIQQIEQATQLKQLAQKTVIGVGGGFSAGKSRFINSLLGIEALPEALEPCTAVATYLSASHQEQTHALNLLNHHISLKSEQLGQLRHFVGDNSTQNDIQLGELIQYVHLGIPQLTWEHIAFLDTPGYSKADAEHHHHSDEQLAINQLSKADYILWLVNAKNGTIRDEDLQFLQKIQPKQPIFVVLTQSDLVNRSDIEPILQSVRQNLKNRNIKIAGLMAWAAPIMKLQGQRLAGDDIHGWLEKINQPIQYDTINYLDVLIQHVFAKGIIQENRLQQEIETLTRVKNKQKNLQITNIIQLKQKNKTIILQSSHNLIFEMAKIAEHLLNDMRQAAQYHALIIRKFDKDCSDSNSLEWLYQQSCIGIESVQQKFKNLTDDLGYKSIQYKYALSLKYNKDAIHYMFLAARQSYLPAYEWLFDKTYQGNIDALFNLTELFKINNSKSIDKEKLFNYCYRYIRTNNSDQRIEDFIKYQAIKQNDVDAQYTYALIFEEKNNFLSTIEYMFLAAKQSYQLAYDWLFTQANQGNIDAQIRLTELFELGKTNKNDEKTIFNYCYDAIRYKSDQRFFKFVEQQAIDKQIVEAQYLLATCYAFGYVVGINYVQAYQLYENIDIENSVYNKVVIAYRYTGMQKEKTIKFIRDNKNKHNFNILNRTLLIRSFVKPELLDYNQKNAKFKILYQNILFALIFIIIITYILTIAISNATVQYNLGRYSPFTEYWYEKSAIQGNTDAMFALGQYYEKKGDSISIEKAFFWYKKLASQNNYEAMFALAKIYESKGDDTSIEQAIHWYIKLANQDNKDAFKALISIDKKKGLFKNVIFWYQKLVQDKQHNNIYENIEKYKNDSKNKILWLEKAAQTGDIFAIVTLASYYESIGDEKRALKLYKKPVSDEYKAHIIDIANSYHELNDMKNTVIWYKKSAHLGSIDSINFLINYYEKIKETKKMLFWLKVIADSGDINAIEKLATFYKTNKDYNQAIIWYIKAFELGDEYQYAINIGDSYYLKNDINEAESWYQKAADYGIDGADEKLILIEKARQKINEELEIQKRKEKEKFERTGLWKDSATNKVWMRCSLGQIWNGENCENDAQTYNWEQAKFAVDELNEQGYAGYKDWRLPSITELGTLYDIEKGGYKPTIDILFNPTPRSYNWGIYWSNSLSDIDNNQVWFINFSNGNSTTEFKSSNYYVRAIR